MSLAAGMINSLPRVTCFLALPMQLATENDALGTDTLDEVMAFENCFCSSRLWGFFLLKDSRVFYCRVLGLHVEK